MAEKEERIAIVKWNTKNSICPAPTELQCGGAKSCDDCKVGMSRQGAIKKISSHLLMCDISTMDTDEIAEAALNALLEGK